MFRQILVVVFLIFFCVDGGLLAQSPLTIAHSVLAQGDQISFAGDINGDGVEDFLTAAVQPVGLFLGRVSVFSGSDGSLIHQLDGADLNDFFGASACGLGDIDGDGFGDFLVGASRKTGNVLLSGEVQVFSGLTGLPLYTLSGFQTSSLFGHTSAALGDLDNDGVTDFAIGAPGQFSFFGFPASGSVYVYSGKLGTLLYTLNVGPTGMTSSFGFSLAEAGDVNNDGFSDIIVGAPRASSNDGHVFVFSGVDGSLIRSIPSAIFNLRFGYSVDGVGDVNHDGVDDQIVGGIGDSDVFLGVTQPGLVVVLSGSDGSVLHVLTGITILGQTGFGSNVSRAGDIDGDGFFDFAVSELAWNNPTGRVRIHSGEDGSLIYSQEGGPVVGTSFGRALAGGKDVDGDGFPDILVGSRLSPDFYTQLLLAPTLPVSSYQSAVGNTSLFLTWHSDGSDPSALTGFLRCTGASPASFGLFGASLTAIDFPLSFGIPLLIANDPVNLLAAAPLGFDSFGELHVPNVSLLNPFLAGTHVFLQFFETSPTIRSSNGLRLLIH